MSKFWLRLSLLQALTLIGISFVLQGWIVLQLLSAVHRAPDFASMSVLLAWQALAASLAAPGALTLMPKRFRQGGGRTLLYLWCFAFSIPVGGLALTCGTIALGAWLPRDMEEPPISLLYEPQFISQQPTVAYGRGAHLKSALLSPEAATSFRMTALMAMQSMPMRTVSPLLREMLDDRYEDIRLLAFWMLDRQEKDLTQKILSQMPKLKLALSPAERYRVNKELALLYNELIYAYLVQGDVYRHAARQADSYAAQALEQMPDDASLWRLRGRLALDRGDTESALQMLTQAQLHGYDRARLLPYLAEVAYLRRDFAAVSRLLEEIPSATSLPMLRPLLVYWEPRICSQP
jgi:hypothetical protein